jgi:hypothetical protein
MRKIHFHAGFFSFIPYFMKPSYSKLRDNSGAETACMTNPPPFSSGLGTGNGGVKEHTFFVLGLLQ